MVFVADSCSGSVLYAVPDDLLLAGLEATRVGQRLDRERVL